MFVRSIRHVVSGRRLASVTPEMTVRAACDVLQACDTDATVVLKGDDLLGILCARDVIFNCICAGLSPDEAFVSEVMTPNPRTVTADQGLADALVLMTDGGFHHLPVLDGGQVIAILSIDDIPAEYRMMAERFAEFRASVG